MMYYCGRCYGETDYDGFCESCTAGDEQDVREEGNEKGRTEAIEALDHAVNAARKVGRLSIIINKKRDDDGDVVVTVNAGGWQGKNMKTAHGYGEPYEALLYALRAIVQGDE